MKILKLSASFGNLQNAELTLEDGLNIVTAPNESGKSTWAAFLTAMLYGMDSSARATKTSLPAKAKYKPWSGAPMQGKMELEWQGRRITIERSTKGRVPMGEFRAYETESGLPVAGMTGENCGEMLLGVGQSVLERSAFIGQGAVAVTSDAELEKRLSSLVTAGDETVSFSDTQKTLRDWRNRCRHNRTGLLPQTLMELQQVENTLDQIHRLHQGDMALRAKREQCTKQQQHLQTVLAGLRAREAARAFEKKDAAARELADASARCADAKKSVERLPSAQTLAELQRQLDLLCSEMHPLPEPQPAPPQAPPCPAVFLGLSEEALSAQARKDAQEAESLSRGSAQSLLPALCALAAALLLCIGTLFLPGGTATVILRAVLLAAALAGGAWAVLLQKKNRACRARTAQAQAILNKYGVSACGDIVPLATEYCGALHLYAQKQEQHEQELARRAAQAQALSERQARLLGQVSMFAPGAATPEQALDAVRTALALLDCAERAEQAERTAQSRYDAICTALGDAKPQPAPEADLEGYEPKTVSRELLQLNSTLSDVRSQLDQSRGRAEALGDPAELEARREALTAQAEHLSRRYDALERALDALEAANSELQTRFSPQISSLAGKLLAKLTGARYDTVLLGSSMQAETREAGELVTRQLLYLSGGTADQVYLAVRLAICRLALGADVPVVLDDALVRFDDERLRAALALLKEEAASRQIILFTCQKREQAALAELHAAEHEE